ncbi:MAG: glycosyltransferase family 4 protein [Planctomycetota bacterium]
MRILHANDLDRGGAGAETHLLGLALRQREAGHEVEVFGAEQPLPSPRASATWWSDREAERLRIAIRAFRPDVVHFHNAAFLSPAALETARACCDRVVMTLHDYRHEPDPLLEGQRRPPLWRALPNRLKRAWVRRHVRRCCTALVAPSRDLAERTRAWAGDVPVVHAPYAMAPADAVTDPKPDAPFLFLGRLVPDKGLRTLVRALAMCHRPRIVEIAGDGPLRDELLPRKNLLLLGEVDRDEVPFLLGRCRALIQPSEWLENQPLAVLEAQAHARAVIATTAGGLPEIVVDGASGLTVPPFDPGALAAALDRLADDEALCARLGRAGRARLAHDHRPAVCDARLAEAYLV